MEMSEVVQLISTVGFPIVCAGALFWYIVKEQRTTRAVVEDNTKVMVSILEHMREGDGDAKS